MNLNPEFIIMLRDRIKAFNETKIGDLIPIEGFWTYTHKDGTIDKYHEGALCIVVDIIKKEGYFAGSTYNDKYIKLKEICSGQVYYQDHSLYGYVYNSKFILSNKRIVLDNNEYNIPEYKK